MQDKKSLKHDLAFVEGLKKVMKDFLVSKNFEYSQLSADFQDRYNELKEGVEIFDAEAERLRKRIK